MEPVGALEETSLLNASFLFILITKAHMDQGRTQLPGGHLQIWSYSCPRRIHQDRYYTTKVARDGELLGRWFSEE